MKILNAIAEWISSHNKHLHEFEKFGDFGRGIDQEWESWNVYRCSKCGDFKVYKN